MQFILLVAATLVAAQTVAPVHQASPVTTPAADVAVSRATAAALARALAPSDLMIPLELDQARKAILAMPTLDEDAKQLEQDYPGIYAAVWSAIEPEMRRSTEANYPAFWAALEGLYLSRLTEAEAQAILTFMRTPSGQKLLRNMLGNFDATPLLADMVKTDASTIGAQKMQAATDAAKAKTVQQIGPEDKASLLALAASIDMAKFRALGVETQKVTLDWVNKEDPEGEDRLGKIMQAAMEKYMAAHPIKESQ